MRHLCCALLLVLLCGCSHTRYIGRVGNVQFYKVSAPSFTGPTINMIVTKPFSDPDAVRVEGVFGGNGLGPALVGSAGLVGAAATLKPTRINSNSSSGSQAGASGGNSSSASSAMSSADAAAMTGPNRTRPPDNRPPKWRD